MELTTQLSLINIDTYGKILIDRKIKGGKDEENYNIFNSYYNI
jgi:hypothetical protein